MNAPAKEFLKIRVAYDPTTQRIIGCAVVNTELGPRALCASIRLEPLAKTIADKLMAEELQKHGVSLDDEIGAFGFIGKAFNKVVSKAMSVAKAVGVTKVVTKLKNAAIKVAATTKKVLESPAFAAAIGVVALAVPGAGPIIGASYAAVRAAMMIASKAAKGDPAALATAGKYASGLIPGGEKVTALLQSVAPITEGVPPDQNKWLQGLQSLLPAAA